MTSPPGIARSPAPDAPFPTSRVAVLLEAPRPGFVPGPLAEAVGAKHALRLLRVVARRTLDAVRAAGAEPLVWFTPPDALPEMRHWLGPSVDYRPHESVSPIPLVAELATRGPWLVVRPAGAGLEAAHLAAAGRALAEGRPVFGPTAAGGLWLLGGPPAFAATAAELPWGEPGIVPALRAMLGREPGPAARELDTLPELVTAEDARSFGLLT